MSTPLNFDLTRLSDRALNLLTRGCIENKSGSAVVAAVRDLLIHERRRRAWKEDYDPAEVALDLPALSLEEMQTCSANLIADVGALETAAALAQGDEQAELLVAAEFLSVVGEALLAPRNDVVN